MHHKAPDGVRVEVNTERDRPERRIVDIHGTPYGWLRLGSGNNNRVVPLRDGETLSVNVGEQKGVLMDVERVVREGAVDNGPLFEVTRNHIVKQWLILGE